MTASGGVALCYQSLTLAYMPKKRNVYPHAKPSIAPHPSLATEKTKATANPSESSVNNRLQQLRLEQRSSSPSVYTPQAPPNHPLPPSVQQILRIPETPSPRPRPGLTVRGGRRGPAGPAPPGSWLQKRQTRPSAAGHTEVDRNLVGTAPLPDLALPDGASLLDQTYRSLAQRWEDQVVYQQHYLATLPVRMKETLLYYVARHHTGGIDASGLRVLFYDEEELEGATGTWGLKKVDLSGSIGYGLSLSDLKRLFETLKGSGNASKLAENVVPDQWDAPSSPIIKLVTPKFADLTHLSLAHPNTSPDSHQKDPEMFATWSSLLAVARYLSSLTHLSLAFWPKPTLRPYSSTAYFSSPAGKVQSSQDTFYSEYDGDYEGQVAVLRQLSKQLLCLKWLDLSGSYPWVMSLSLLTKEWCGPWSGIVST